jgi:hypothetical protein
MTSTRCAPPALLPTSFAAFVLLAAPAAMAAQDRRAMPPTSCSSASGTVTCTPVDTAAFPGKGEDAVRSEIEMEQSTYCPGDTARVQIMLRNTSQFRVIFAFLPPQDLFKLIIKREGKSIAAITQPLGYATLTLAWVELKPHTPRAITTQRWLPLANWGFQLRQAGRYSVQVIPKMFSDYDQRQLFQDTTTIRSNAAWFTIKRCPLDSR